MTGKKLLALPQPSANNLDFLKAPASTDRRPPRRRLAYGPRGPQRAAALDLSHFAAPTDPRQPPRPRPPFWRKSRPIVKKPGEAFSRRVIRAYRPGAASCRVLRIGQAAGPQCGDRTRETHRANRAARKVSAGRQAAIGDPRHQRAERQPDHRPAHPRRERVQESPPWPSGAAFNAAASSLAVPI